MHSGEVPGTGVHTAVVTDRGKLVPALRVETSAKPATPASAAHSWRSRSGQVVAYGGRDRAGCWMTWPHLATYRFSTNQTEIVAYPEPQAAPEILWDTYRRSVLPMAMQACGWEALHASAVSTSEGIVAFSAVSETGKSTLAYGLACRGFTQWADDAVVWSSDDRTTSVPLPFEVRLRDSANRLFGDSLPRPRRLTSNDFGDQRFREPARFHAICVLERQPRTTTPVVERIEPADAFRALLTHAHEFNPSDTMRRAAMLDSYLGVAASVSVYRVGFEPGPGSLSGLLDVLVDEIGLKPTSIGSR